MKKVMFLVLVVSFVATALILPSLAAAKKFPQDKGPTTIDVSKYPKEHTEGYNLFMAKCKKCHTIARPIWSKFQGEDWDRYTKKMMRKPGCPVTPQDQPKIAGFLKYDHKTREKEILDYWKKLEGK
ncbi:MAG: hypothetical protein HYU64_08525 [Armatimonadetes bacterium]|nr:hypothetical protein [Armatimonadota bacterium]